VKLVGFDQVFLLSVGPFDGKIVVICREAVVADAFAMGYPEISAKVTTSAAVFRT
jgi:hypothetical protein